MACLQKNDSYRDLEDLKNLKSVYFFQQITSLPAQLKDSDSKFSDLFPYLYEESCPPCQDTLTSLFENTKDIGLTAWDHLSNAANSVGSSVGGFADDVIHKGVKHTADLLATGHELVASNLQGAKKLGEEGLAMADKAFNYLTEALPRFPSFEMRSEKGDGD